MKDDYENKLSIMMLEYQYLCNIRHQHMGAYVQTNFYFGVLLVVIAGAISTKQEWALLTAPLIIFIQMSLIQWNQYHHFLTEEYLIRLEDNIRDHSNANSSSFIYHGFYRNLFFNTTYLKSDKSIFPIIKPTTLLTIGIGIFNITALIFCICYGRSDFINEFGEMSFNIYIYMVLIFTTLLLYNFIMLPKKIRPILQSYLDEYIKKNNGK